MVQIEFIVFVNNDKNIISNDKNNKFSQFLIMHLWDNLLTTCQGCFFFCKK